MVFVRIHEVSPEDELSPARNHTMLLDSQRVVTVSIDGRPCPAVWSLSLFSDATHAVHSASKLLYVRDVTAG
jgi:hypothetical protein